jgi:hypothetical protein
MKGTIFLILICMQFSILGSSAIGTNFLESNEFDDTNNNTLQKDGTSHSSPYYFPVNQSSPLMTEESSDENPEEGPKLASYHYDKGYVLTTNLDKYALTIGESVTINFGLTANLTAVSGESITVEIYRGFYRYYWYYYRSATPIYSVDLITDSDGQVSMVYSLTSIQGSYTVYAYSEEAHSYKDFTVGAVGIFCKGPRFYKPNQDYRAAIHIVNLTDFSGIPTSIFSYSISYYTSSSSSWLDLVTKVGQTDDNGYAIVDVEIPVISDYYYSIRLTINALDGEAEYQTYLYKTWDHYFYCRWGGQRTTNQEQFQYVVTTDKTIYSPGETIHLRALVLEYSFMNETKHALQNTPIPLVIYNPDEFAIFWTTFTTDEYGIITFNFPLDEDCELGNYGFEFSYSGIDYRYNAKVDYYTKPAFRVEIDTNGKEYYSINEKSFEGFIEAEYYFGQPVVGATVEVVIENYLNEIKYTIEGITNGEGRFYFSINLNSIEDLEYSFNAEARVTDIYSRSASSRKIFSRFEEIYAYGYLTNWAPHPDETLEYYFYVYQYVRSSYNWLSNPLSDVQVKIEIYGMKKFRGYSPTTTEKSLLDIHRASTNEYGSGYIEFKLPQIQIRNFNFFEIRITVTLEDRRSTTSSYYFRYKKYSLDINIEDSSLYPGQTLEFDVTYKDLLTGSPSSGEGRIYIYDARHQLIGRVSDFIAGSKTYFFTIPSFFPEGKYYIYSYIFSRENQYYGGFSYHSAHESFIVGDFQSLTFVSNYSNTGRYYDEITINNDDDIKIQGSSDVSSNIPHYLEIYKRGLVYSTPLEVNNNQFTYILSIEANFLPDFTIMVYSISETGKLYEHILRVHVRYTYGFNLTTDKEVYEPGDSVTLTITPNENKTSVFALSFIDSAVLDVEPEDNSELAYFTMNPYSAYVRSESSWGSRFDATSYWWYSEGTHRGGPYFYYPYFYASLLHFDVMDRVAFGEDKAPTELPSFGELLTSFETEIRKNISESANWKTRLIISEPTDINFKLPDNIGEWTIRAVGNSISKDKNGIVLGGGVETIQIKAFLPFFIEFEVPEPILQDDILSVKGYVYNYIGKDVHATVAIHAPNLIVLNREVQEIFVPNDFVSEIEFSVYCREAYQQNITLLAATEISGVKYSDAKQLTIYITPNGIEVINRTIGYLNASDGSILLNYSINPMTIYRKETLALYTDLMDISIDSWQSLIGYPYGCMEQTISKTLPTALIYDYLNKTGQLTPELDKQITSMILKGLHRIYNFQHYDGGWGWWLDDNSKILMTSIIISALIHIEDAGFHVNSFVLKRGIDYLISNQDPSGSWNFDHYSINSLEATAFILKALMNYNNISTQIELALSKAVNRFIALWEINQGMQSPYAASLFYIATKGTIYENATFNSEVIQYLKNNKRSDGDTIFWDNGPKNNWYWRKLGNKVEVTSYATWALTLDDYFDNLGIIQKAVRYLLNQRSTWGWRTTADTAAAINALTAIKGIILSGGFINFTGNISINVNEKVTPQFLLDNIHSENTPNEILLNLHDNLNQNSNVINISLDGTGGISYIFETTQVLRADPKIEIPEIIMATKNQNFNLTVKFSEIDKILPIQDTSVSLFGIHQDLLDPEASYAIDSITIINGSEIPFSLIAPDTEGDYIIEGVSVLGHIQYNDTSTNSSSYQLVHRTMGPVIVRVGAQSYTSYPLNYKLSNSTLQSIDSLSIKKEISQRNFLIPGDIITVTLKISNTGESRQFYVIEDKQPTGTVVLTDTVNIIGDYSNSNITYSLYSSGIHFFFPILAAGVTEITYNLQVDTIKNSYSGQVKLWGMYDDVSISAQSVILENIPRKYYANSSIYQDLDRPFISSFDVEKSQKGPNIEFSVNLSTYDNNAINKIRVIFSQKSGWRVQTIYSMKQQDDITILLSDFRNIDSKVRIFLEVSDIYGNTITTNVISIQMYAYEIIPYLLIGGVIGFAIGLASLSSVLYKKLEKRKLRSKYRLSDENVIGETKVSFIDETEEDV